MSTLEFRAWDVRKQRMVNDALFLSQTHQLVTVNARYFNSPFSFFDGCIWLQYTTMNDCFGTKIFKADILKLNGGKEDVYFEVDFEYGCWVAKVPWKKDHFPELKYYVGWNREVIHIEVVGNIYANPELLKKNKL